jgi:HK97 family phage major capsid protein
MSKIKEAQERKNKLVVEARSLGKEYNENKKVWKDQEQENRWNAVNKDLSSVDEEIKTLRDQEAVDARLAEFDEMETRGQREQNGQAVPGRENHTPKPGTGRDSGPTDALSGVDDEEVRALALAGWLRSGHAEPTERQALAMTRAGLSGRSREISIGTARSDFSRGLQSIYRSTGERFRESAVNRYLENRTVSVGGSAANLIPTTLLSSLEVSLLAFGSMLQVADVMQTADGGAFDWPTATDVSNTGVLLAEETTFGASVDPTFSKMTLNAYKYSSKPILVSHEILQDSVIDLPRILGEMLGERLGRIENAQATNGTGTNQPNGLITASTVGKTAASATTFTELELIDLVHSVDPAYRSAPGVRFMFNDTVLAHLRKMQDSNGQFLWQPGMREGETDRVFGYQYSINQDMDSAFTTGKILVAFGDMSKYKIRKAGPTRLKRLDERYADTDQVAFIAFQRMDGDLINTGAIKTLDLL